MALAGAPLAIAILRIVDGGHLVCGERRPGGGTVIQRRVLAPGCASWCLLGAFYHLADIRRGEDRTSLLFTRLVHEGDHHRQISPFWCTDWWSCRR
jgi:hypothetical protein